MLGMLGAVLLLAQAEAPPAPAAAPEAAAEERRIKAVCKDRARTGSRFTKVRCMELEEYRRSQEADRRNFEEWQNRPQISTARGG